MRHLPHGNVLCSSLLIGLIHSVLICPPCSAQRMSAESNQAPPSKSVPSVEFSDAAGRVNFRYPSAWTVSDTTSLSYAPAIRRNEEPVNFLGVFRSAGSVLDGTTLEYLAFLYRRVSASSKESCVKMASANLDPEHHPTDLTINGVTFTQLTEQDGSNGGRVQQEVYVSYRDQMCFMFESDLAEANAHQVAGRRDLTTAQEETLKRLLHRIVETIRFTVQAPANTKSTE